MPTLRAHTAFVAGQIVSTTLAVTGWWPAIASPEDERGDANEHEEDPERDHDNPEPRAKEVERGKEAVA